jgi:hypothetical protein
MHDAGASFVPYWGAEAPCVHPDKWGALRARA